MSRHLEFNSNGVLRTLEDDAGEPRYSRRGEFMRAILEIVQGPLKGRHFVLDRQDNFIVGRSRFVHCPMPEDLALSRDHFMIESIPPRVSCAIWGARTGRS